MEFGLGICQVSIGSPDLGLPAASFQRTLPKARNLYSVEDAGVFIYLYSCTYMTSLLMFHLLPIYRYSIVFFGGKGRSDMI